MYQAEFHPAIDKDLKKLPKSIKIEIRDKHIPKILAGPNEAGKNLVGKLSGLRSYSFTSNKVEYRIVYDIFEERIAVLFLMVGPRERFYERLLRRILG